MSNAHTGGKAMELANAQSLMFKIKGKPAVPVISVADAAKKWDDYRMASMMQGGGGCSQIGNGGIVRDGKKIVAKISYNGRIWE
jgi:hypothetical protein